MKSAVLFLVFNRPETTQEAFQAIRAAQPARLYVSADGPRAGRPSEVEQCTSVRAIACAVDWPCEVHTLFQEVNLGCKAGVVAGIDWFFTHEDEGIILEDDVLPDPSFFLFCDELLEYYREDTRVSAISGCNLISEHFSAESSYFFSRYCHVWGWATWRRAWDHYDVAMSEWPAWRSRVGLGQTFSSRSTEEFWRRLFDDTFDGNIDTWDFQWLFACWRRDTVCAVPTHTLTHNLGFGAEATHTTGAMPSYVRAAQTRSMRFPLTHPGSVERCAPADLQIDRVVFGSSAYSRFRMSVKALARSLRWPRFLAHSKD